MFHEFKFWREMFQDVFIESRAGLAPDGREVGGGVGGEVPRWAADRWRNGGEWRIARRRINWSDKSRIFSIFLFFFFFFWLHQKRGRLGGPKEKNPKGFFRRSESVCHDGSSVDWKPKHKSRFVYSLNRQTVNKMKCYCLYPRDYDQNGLKWFSIEFYISEDFFSHFLHFDRQKYFLKSEKILKFSLILLKNLLHYFWNFEQLFLIYFQLEKKSKKIIFKNSKIHEKILNKF